MTESTYSRTSRGFNVHMLNTKTTEQPKLDEKHLAVLATLQVKLASLGVEGHFLPSVSEGPVVTLYRFVPQNATRVSLVERVAPDLAITLGAECVQVKRLPGEMEIGRASW